MVSFFILLSPSLLSSPPSLTRSNTLVIVFFQWTYSLDLTSLYIAEVKDDERKGEEGAKESEKHKLPL